MNRYARLGLLVATVVGLAIAIWTVGAVGARHVLAAMASIGWLGMLAFVAWSGGVLALLGLAWLAVAPGEGLHRLPLFIWARATREAATDILPFSQFGGLVVGARTLGGGRLPSAIIYASMIADLTTEMAAQTLFTLAGVTMLTLVLSSHPIAADIIPLAIASLVALVGVMAAFAFAQRPMLTFAGKLAERVLPNSVAVTLAISQQLDAIYRAPRRVIAAFLVNLAAWIASAAGAWIALRFMGAHTPLWAVLTIEALIFTLRSVAFMVPGAIGLQEAAYTLIGPLFGLPPTTALALSLLKRARDIAIGLPTILIWQLGEMRAMAIARPMAGSSGPD